MRVNNNNQTSFGTIVLKKTVKYPPQFVQLITDNAHAINELTPGNDVFGYFHDEQECIYLVKINSKNKIGKFFEKISILWKALCSEMLFEDARTMPQQAESLRLPVTKNGLFNALRKITGKKAG